jgi:hypothetical protein
VRLFLDDPGGRIPGEIAALESRGIRIGEKSRSTLADVAIVQEHDRNQLVFAHAKSDALLSWTRLRFGPRSPSPCVFRSYRYRYRASNSPHRYGNPHSGHGCHFSDLFAPTRLWPRTARA